MRPVKVRIGRTYFEIPGEIIPFLVGTFGLVGDKLMHFVLKLVGHR